MADVATLIEGATRPTMLEDSRENPRLFYLHPLQAGALRTWPAILAQVAALGFSHVVLPPPLRAADLRLLDDPDQPHPALDAPGDADAAVAALDAAGRAAGLGWMLDVRLDAVAGGGRLARERPHLFASPDAWAAITPDTAAGPARLRPDAGPDEIVDFWTGLLGRWRAAGAAGFRLRGLDRLDPGLVESLAARQRRDHGESLLLGVLPDDDAGRLSEWRGAGLDRVELAIDRWDQRSTALLAHAAALSEVAPIVAAVERPFGPRFAGGFARPEAWIRAARRLLQVAATLGDGWMLPAGFATGERLRMDGRLGHPDEDAGASVLVDPALVDAVRAANAPTPAFGPARPLPTPGAGIDGLVRRLDVRRLGVRRLDVRRLDDCARVTLVNRGAAPATVPLGRLVPGYVTEGDTTMSTTLAAGEVRSVDLVAAPMIRQSRDPRARSATDRASSGRIAIEKVTPAVDDGRFAAKRIVGDVISVSCDIICDGHDQLAAAVQWRALDQTAWHEARLVPLGNDRWQASFALSAVGRWLFRVAAWRDLFATFRDELGKKHKAGLNVSLEVREGRAMIEDAVARDPELADTLDRLDAAPLADQVALLLSEPVAAAMRAADARPFLTESQNFPIDADRPQAQFASWYEIFPRSMSDDVTRHGTFRDVIRHLPRIRDMGFDVLYFPPIHPIGRTNRKGRNNTLTPAPDDPGSPYAIGSDEGGHDALHPELGSFEDFEELRQQAKAAGMELALDFAIQCAPDHPWLKQHKGWFDWRPDGSIRYAENPPKKYEDIVNVDFYARDAVPDLWVALSDAVFFWLDRGVRILRIDNPHTKPFPFWEWLIHEVRCAYPDAIFLAEAFTRPKVMNRLGKVGFHQSYTYFTWRNTKAELTEYLTTLTTTEARDFFRPNFFVNTPDINPVFLQTSGRAGFLIRAALAATLAGSWGVYCGFELCEAAAVPGKEEYLDSEKYQLRAWDWDRPGNIVAEITRLNMLRRMHPCLWSHLGITFLGSDDDQVLFYEKATPDRSDVLLIAISLDPYNSRSSAIELPLWRWGLSDQASLDCRDVLHDTRFTLPGKWQRVALSPDAPYTIWHASPQGAYTA